MKDVATARFVDYLLSPQGQSDIGRYRINGEQVFHPDAAGVPD